MASLEEDMLLSFTLRNYSTFIGHQGIQRENKNMNVPTEGRGLCVRLVFVLLGVFMVFVEVFSSSLGRSFLAHSYSFSIYMCSSTGLLNNFKMKILFITNESSSTNGNGLPSLLCSFLQPFHTT